MTKDEINQARKKIKQARREQNLKQNQVAQYIGKSRSWLSQVENQQKNINYDQLKKISEITQKPLSWFLHNEENHWKAQRYDLLTESFLQIYGAIFNKNYTEMDEREKDSEFARMGINDASLREFCKQWPYMPKERQEAVMILVQDFLVN